MATAKTKTTSHRAARANGAGSLWTDPATGYLYAVVTWTIFDPESGAKKLKRRTRKAKNKTHAYELIEEMKAELKIGGEKAIDGARVTFGQLADYHKERHLIPEVRNKAGKKIKGLKTWSWQRDMVDTIVAYFGAGKLITSLTFAEVQDFKADRLCAPLMTGYRQGKKGADGKREELVQRVRLDANGEPIERSVAAVHAELARLKAMFNAAAAEGWLTRANPAAGKKLINAGEENKREKILLDDDEDALLAQFDDPRRRHLKPYVITAIDSGARSIELRRLRVGDLNFDDPEGLFEVFSDKGKLRHFRTIIMTPRVREALLGCCEGKTAEDFVFTHGKNKRPFAAAPKRAWTTAKREAEYANDVSLAGLRGHDLRHTMITRAIESGAPIAEVGKYAGHRQPSTTWRYVNPSEESNRRIARLIGNRRPAAAPVASLEEAKEAKAAEAGKVGRKSKAA